MRNFVLVAILLSMGLFIFTNIFGLQNEHRYIKERPTTGISEVATEYDLISYQDKILCKNISKKLGISYPGILTIGHLADEYISNNVPKDIDSTGYVFQNNIPINPKEFKKLLDKIHQTEYVVFNPKSLKYHKLDCKFAQEMKGYKILEKSKLSQDVTPCKFCHKTNIKHSNKTIPTPSLEYKTNGIKAFLTDYTTNIYPTKECSSNICKELVTQINNAQSSIDMALYGYEKIPAIDFALTNAINRGVKIRLVYDINSKNENIYPDTKYLANIVQNSKCDVAPDDYENKSKYTNALMHNKFYVFDNKTVLTGSANLGSHDMCSFNSNSVIEINSPEIAQIYTQEFEQMYNNKFHKIKEKIEKPTNIQCGKTSIKICFSPKDNIAQTVIVPLINNAQKYIYMPTFLITNKSITNALIQARKRGVEIKIIVDAVNAKSKSSTHKILRENGILVKTENYAGKLHSKSIIIDDKYTIIGSMNFSHSGNYSNDENIVLITNENIAIFYKKFFEYLWAKIDTYWQTHDVSAESIYSIGSCCDGIDNDYDGLIDKEDPACCSKR